MLSLARRIVDVRVLHLIKMWLECAVEETDDRGRKTRTTEAKDQRRGIPQGSPFLGANDPYKALTSRPFPKPKSGRIAIKVINHLGDEVMKVFKVG